MKYSKNIDYVYVVDINGNPLQPTNRKSMVRKLLKNGEAKVFKRDPHFTIQLLKNTTNFYQEICMGKSTV